MEYEIQHSPGAKILIRKFFGETGFDQVMESWEQLIREKMIGENISGILNDFTEAKLEMNPGNLDSLMEFFKEYPGIFERIKLAVVMTLPDNIVLPILANRKYPQYKIQAFSTLSAARQWLETDT